MRLLLLLSLSFFITNTSSAQARDVSQWRPYLEWSATNTTYTENPFDLIASVRFTHSSGQQISTEMFYDENNTWRWRFTGTLPGLWNWISTSSDPELNQLSGTVNVTQQNVNGFYQKMSGDKWGWSGTDRAVVPNYVMIDALPSAWDTKTEANALADRFFNQHGFNGFHIPSVAARWFKSDASSDRFSSNPELNSPDTNPDPNTFRALETLIQRTHINGGSVHIWLWGDSSRRQNLTRVTNNGLGNLTGGANGVVDQRLNRYLAARLGAIPGWSAGYGYDLFEWINDEQLTTWHRYLNRRLGWPHFLGARGNKNEIIDSQISESLDFNDYEQHRNLYDFSDYIQTHRDRPGKPSMSGDRFRIRTSFNAKDLQPDGSDTRTLMWQLTMAGGIAAIWGNLWDGNNNTNVDRGSLNYPTLAKSQIKTFDTFWNIYGRFRADLMTNTNLATDGETAIMVNAGRSHWVLYRENTSEVQVDLSQMPVGMSAVAINTKASYQEFALGVLANQNQTITLPSNSDWAIAIGDFSTDAEPVLNARLALSIVATPNKTDVIGQVINYRFQAKNIGDLELSDVRLTASNQGSLVCQPLANLAVNISQTLSCTGDTYVSTQDDIGNNNVRVVSARIGANSVNGEVQAANSIRVLFGKQPDDLCLPIVTELQKIAVICL